MARHEGESTMEYLGRTLESVGLRDMARRARLGHFDNYFCPEEVATGMELNRLVAELKDASNLAFRFSNRDQAARIADVAVMVFDGEFDGTKEESERWVASPEGQAVLNELGPEVTKVLFGEQDGEETETSSKGSGETPNQGNDTAPIG